MIPRHVCLYGPKNCSFDGVYQPSLESTRFLAMGNFYEVTKNVGNLLKTSFDGNMSGFSEATYKICSFTYVELKNLEKSTKAEISNKKLKKLCLESVYIIKVFELYGFKSWSQVEFVELVIINFLFLITNLT